MTSPSYPLELSKVRDFLINILPTAGQIIRRYYHAEMIPQKKKGTIDFVTVADLKADEFLRDQLHRQFPDIPVLTEETAPSDLDQYIKHELLFIVDPLDGTANFARGDANYSISVGLSWKGQSILGVLFVPVSSRMFWAQADRDGAYWNGRRIHVSTVSNLYEAVVCTDWSHILSTRDSTTNFLKKVFGHVRQIKILGSAATNLSLLALGAIDIYSHVHLMPWDTAAAVLIAQKAGATVSDSKGYAWNVFTPDILAANSVLHRKMLKFLSGKRTSK
ncbi:hypothetical protein HYW55_01505 [Candidatus Gottesmanbacteria bacterium]|nr:hypothetical protein [Candidatus Gottesmanbacteria bacterium]